MTSQPLALVRAELPRGPGLPFTVDLLRGQQDRFGAYDVLGAMLGGRRHPAGAIIVNWAPRDR